MEFHDFQIRGWTINSTSASVLVHSSPAGAMQRPETVKLDWKILSAFREIFQLEPEKVNSDHLADGGRMLAKILFPDPVITLLIQSLERIDREDGLRIRLCLDGSLTELPWEYIVLPDFAGLKTTGGILAIDQRISLIREPPQPGNQRTKLQKRQRLMFFGTRRCYANGEDMWKCAEERDKLFKALEPASSHLETLSVLSNETDCSTALKLLSAPVDIFHYSGHTDVENGEGYLVANDLKEGDTWFEKLYAKDLGNLLRRAGTTIAVFSACNSGNWAFVEPLLKAGIPVVVGAQGQVCVEAAIAFCTRVYSALAVGLSLDEAVTWARLYLLQSGLLGSLSWQWGLFMVYMQTPEAVLFPKPREAGIGMRQKAMRTERNETIKKAYKNILIEEGKKPQIPLKVALKYLDFNLRIANYNKSDDTYKVWVEGDTPGGTMSPDNAVILKYDPGAFWTDPILGTGGMMGKLDRRTIKKVDLFELGRLLSEMAFPGTVRSLFDMSHSALGINEGLRIRLRIDALELKQLPWEFLMLQQTSGEPQASDFLVLRREISIVRTDTVEAGNRKLPNWIPKIVGVFACPGDQENLNIESDKNALETSLDAYKNTPAGQQVLTTWVEKPATQSKLVEAMQDGADIFQYSGHAAFDLNQEGILCLENEIDDTSYFYEADRLAELLRNANVRLAVLSACETGRRNGQMVWSGIAPALTREKILAVIANQFDIEDKNATIFASRIYPLLFAGFTVDEALFEARQSIYQRNGLENRDWGVPVLYLQDETGVLFPLNK
jgi:hypothetical protein